jgi:hypothetical protein
VTTAPATPEAPVVSTGLTAASAVFSDVAPTSWYHDVVTYVYTRGLMTGTDTGFQPNGTMNRAMMMTVLARMAGADTTGSGEFWYAKAMSWAVACGISDGSAPLESVTREQVVTMLYRYAGSPEASGDLTGFPDASSVSAWAADAMSWAVSTGVISGTNTGLLNPTGTATRAELAAILMRLVESGVK